MNAFKPAGWHQYTPTTSFRELCYWELLHEEGSFPISIFCESLGGGEVPLELLRTDENLLAIYYLSENAAEYWEVMFRSKFEEAGWNVIEKARDGIFIPKAVGKVIPREFPLLLVDAIEDSIAWMSPETIRTGNMADPSYSCPSN